MNIRSQAPKLALIGILLVIVAAVAGLGSRCEERSYLGFRATVCTRWFRPAVVTLTDSEQQVFYYGLLDRQHRTHDLPTQEFVDLFGSGRISQFVVNAGPGATGYATTQRIATRDDGRVDVTLEFDGRALSHATVVDRSACSSWRGTVERIRGRAIRQELCTDRGAVRPIDAEAAVRLLDGLKVRADRRRFLIDRLNGSIGRTPGPELRM